jgi:hypothetical protein
VRRAAPTRTSPGSPARSTSAATATPTSTRDARLPPSCLFPLFRLPLPDPAAHDSMPPRPTLLFVTHFWKLSPLAQCSARVCSHPTGGLHWRAGRGTARS